MLLSSLLVCAYIKVEKCIVAEPSPDRSGSRRLCREQRIAGILKLIKDFLLNASNFFIPIRF